MSDSNTIELLCQLTHISNLQQLCDLTYSITGNPVFISDLAHTILAYTKCVVVSNPLWEETVVQAHLERNTLRQDREVGSVHLLSTESHWPVLVTDDYIPYPRIIKTLSSEGQAVGVMVLTSYLQPFGDHDRELVELISSFAVPCLMRERYHISPNNRAVENYFIKLLDGAVFSRERVIKRLDVLGYALRPYTYVLTVCAKDGTGGQDSKDLTAIIAELAATLRGCVFLYNSTLVCLYGCDHAISDWPSQVPGLGECLERNDLIAGVSRQVSGLERLREYYLQAQEILELGRRLERRYACYPYDNLSSFLLLDRLPRESLDLYCHQQIQELGAYDLTHNTELCITLQVYLEQAKSLARTADILFIHRNTVRYRINRCMELLGNRLEDGNMIFAYILSLRILEYERKILHAEPYPSQKSLPTAGDLPDA